MGSILSDLTLFLLGGAGLAAAVRAWRPEVGWRATAAYLLAVLAFFSPVLLTSCHGIATDIAYVWPPFRQAVAEEVRTQNPLLGDPLQQMLPFHLLVRQRLLAGRPPLWAHQISAGQPLLGAAQSAPLAPLHLAALPLPPLRALTVAAAWQVLLSLLLTHALLLRLGASAAGAALAAIGFSFGGFAVSWLYYPLGMTAAWLPGVFLALLLLRRGERGGVVGLAVCGAGMAASGHPELLAQSAVAAAVAVAVLLARPGPGRRRFLRRLTAALGLAFCLAAPVLLPVGEALAESLRAFLVSRAPQRVHAAAFEGRFLGALVDPFVSGSPRDHNWSRPEVFNEVAAGYAGLVTLALVVAGAGRRPRLLAPLAGGLVALLAAVRVAPFFSLFDLVPVLEHAPRGRLRVFWALAAAVAAGLAVDGLAEDRRGRRLAAAGLAAVAGALLALPPAGGPWQWLWWGVGLAGLVAAGAALAVPSWRRRFAAVALVALAADLAVFGIRYNPVLPPRLDLRPPPEVAFLVDRAAAAPRPFRVVAQNHGLLVNLASYYGLWDPRGYDPAAPAASADFVRRALSPRYSLRPQLRWREDDRPALFSALGIRYVLAPRRARLRPPFHVVFRGPGGRVWENPAALPLFFMPRRVRTEPDREGAMQAALRAPDLGEVVFVEGKAGPAAGQRGEVWLQEVTANGFELVVRGRGGLVASSVSHARPWRVVVDGGRPAAARRVDGAFLGCAVPPGLHRVSLRYLPAGWVVGMGLGGVGLAALASLLLTPPRRRAGMRPQLRDGALP